jgi:hypothetical protein
LGKRKERFRDARGLRDIGFVGSQRRKDAKDAEALRFWEKGRKG